MKSLFRKGLLFIFAVVLVFAFYGSVLNAAANTNPSWTVDDPVIFHRQCTPYDYYGAKDPTIVYYGGKYLVYYTGANQSGGWQMCFTSASTIEGLKTAPRTFMSKISESYFCAPELFYFEPQNLWYLVYQDGTHGAAYSTSTDPTDPNSWKGPQSFGISGNMGWDYFIICDDQYAYMYNTPSAGGGKVYMRKTTLANFPNKGWSSSTAVVSNVFEGAEVYKSIADGQYYLLIEEQINGRSYELFTSPSAGGPWTLVNKTWASVTNIKTYNGKKWTTNVSHGELIRAGYNQKLEINDINHVDFLIQGTTSLSGEYQQIIWDLGLIRNYPGTFSPPGPIGTPTPKATPVPQSAFSQIEAESFSNQSGIQTETCSEGGEDIGYIEDGDYAVYEGIDFGSGTSSFQARIASGTSGGGIEIRLDSIDGTIVGYCSFTGTGDWQTWETSTCSANGISGKHDLYLKFTGNSGYLFNLNWWKFSPADPTPSSTPVSTPPTKVSIDINHDGVVNMNDVVILASAFNSARGDSRYVAAYDLNSDGAINMNDVMILAADFNKKVATITQTPTVKATPTPTIKPTPTPGASKFHCFLLLGQSNMAGYAKTQASDRVEDPRVLVLGYDNNAALGRVTDQWDVACPPLHPAWLDAIGPGDWFGKTMIQKVPEGDTIGLIPCAISGEKIETFMKSGGSKYDWIVKRARLAQQKGGVIEGIIFHQGESNNGQSDWPNKVKTLVEDLRTDLNLGDIPFLPGELPYKGTCAGHNTLVNKLPSLIKNCYVVSANGLVVDPSDTTYNMHFSHDSAVELGKRYAQKMIEVLGW